MSVQKLTQVTVQGLATNPNPNALPAGSCAVAFNCLSRRPGILAPLPTFATVADTGAVSGQKMLFDDIASKNVIVRSDFNGTANGALQSFTISGTTVSVDSAVTQLPSNMSGTKRDLVFLPGKTQSVSSHFRHLITERAGVVVNQERWAGLPPPFGAQLTVTADANGFLLDTQSVAYRTNFTLESTDDTKGYIVNGPVSAINAITNDSGSLCRVDFVVTYPVNEPIVAPTGTAVYLNIYRSSQADVDTVAELAQDFRLVSKFIISGTSGSFADRVSDTALAAGEPLYTNNIGQFGDQASNYPPPSSSDVCLFKDTAFYANRKSYEVVTLIVPGAYGQLQSAKDRTYGIGERPYVTATTVNGSAVITFTDPNELLGLVPGQRISSAAFSGTAVISSINVGLLQVTMTSAAVGVSVATGSFWDQITVIADYENITSVIQTADVLKSDYAIANVKGVRVLHGAVDRTNVVYGPKLLVQSVWNANDAIDNIGVCVTNGQNYSPPYTGNYLTSTVPLISIGDTRPNRLFYSKTGEPEACPLGNYIDVGSGTIIKMWANQSALLVCCTDGLWKITEGDPFPVYQIDPTARLVHPDCLTSLNNIAYGWVTDGIAQITEDGATTISTDAVGPILRSLYNFLGGTPTYRWGFSLAGDSLRNELWFSTTDVTGNIPTGMNVEILYNDDTKNFTTFGALTGAQGSDYDFGMYSPVVGKMVFLLKSGSPEHTFILAQSDSYSAGGIVPVTYLPMTIWFNPLQTDEKGNLKQFIDLNYFTANFAENPAAGTDYMKALFNAKGEASDSTLDTVNIRNMALISRDVHYFVPRRTALSDQQQIGIQTFTLDEEELDTAFYIEIQGFTMRYRVASSTLKR